ncbi:MAG: LOG family protein, partial [Legionella sp.]|nr:LOG family protein [Legionella sp.]
GIGTLLELFYSWQLVQVGQICETPIILFGEIWRPLLHWLNEEVLRRGFIGAEDLQGVFVLDSASGVVDLIHRIHEDRSRSANVCVNFEKYRV